MDTRTRNVASELDLLSDVSFFPLSIFLPTSSDAFALPGHRRSIWSVTNSVAAFTPLNVYIRFLLFF